MDVKKIYLASESPRRKALLEQVGLEFKVIKPYVSEELTGLPAREEAERLAVNKAKSIVVPETDAVIIGVDTIVTFEDKILGKPVSRQDAFGMLRVLSGRSHSVISGVAVRQTAANSGEMDRILTGTEVTEVTFRPLVDDEIEAYLNTDEPWDKAGSYAIQGKAALFVSGIRGDYYNVVGLPLSLLDRLLTALGVRIWLNW